MNRAIFLDFDGVLFDTVKEAYAVAMFALDRAKETSEIDYDSDEYGLFKKYRYLINPAWNYFYLIKTIDMYLKDNSIDIEKKYKKDVLSAQKIGYEDFENKYFASREKIKNNNYQYWLSLNEPYPFLSVVPKLIHKSPNSVFIITTKDRPTVLKLLAINGIDFNPLQIFGRESYDKYGGKLQIIEDLAAKHNIKEALFVDDSSEHLSSCKSMKGLTLLQPDWGYVSSKDKVDSLGSILNKVNEFLEVN